MAYLKGVLLVSNNAPLIQKNPWDYISTISPQVEGETTTPVTDADLKIVLSVSSDVITRGLSSDEGDFYLRVPSGIDCFIEASLNQKLILMKYIHVQEKREINVGTLDLASTAEALLIKKRLLKYQDDHISSPNLEKMFPQIENCWKNGISLSQLYMNDITPPVTSASRYDPFHLITSFNATLDDRGEAILWNWETREPCHARLFYRTFRSRSYRWENFPTYRKKGKFSLNPLREFEGYIFYLEVQTRNGLLALTPPQCLRVPIKSELNTHRFIGRQEGPVIIARRPAHGKKTFHIPPIQFELQLKGALEKSFESEQNLEFANKIKIPRFILREGYHELEFNIYFPQEHSFMWGPIEELEELSIDNHFWETIKNLWEKTQIEVPQNCVLEIGYSTPFSEIISYRKRSHFRLFSNMDLSDTILILTYRHIDTLDLDCVQFFQGYLNLQGEGPFSDYQLQLKIEGRFDEEKIDDPIIQNSRDINGNVALNADMIIELKKTDPSQ